jgi:hypothetical protein
VALPKLHMNNQDGDEQIAWIEAALNERVAFDVLKRKRNEEVQADLLTDHDS